MSQQRDSTDESEIISTNPLLLVPSISKINLNEEVNYVNRFSGIFYSLTASFLFVGSTFIIQKIGVDLLDALPLRFLLQTIITLSFALFKRHDLIGNQPKEIILQVLCALTGAIGVVLFFLAIRYIELSDANTLYYTRVVWTVLLSIIVYRERPSLSTLLALPLTFLGVVFVTQPNLLFSSIQPSINDVKNRYSIIGYIISLGCALTSALNVLLYKQLISASKNIKPSVLTCHCSFFVFILLILNQIYRIFYLKLVAWDYFLSTSYLLSSIVCLLAIVATVLTQKAIKREHPSVVSLLGSAEIMFALLFQNLFTSVQSNLYTILGSVLVISGVAVLGVSKFIDERKTMKSKSQLETRDT